MLDANVGRKCLVSLRLKSPSYHADRVAMWGGPIGANYPIAARATPTLNTLYPHHCAGQAKLKRDRGDSRIMSVRIPWRNLLINRFYLVFEQIAPSEAAPFLYLRSRGDAC